MSIFAERLNKILAIREVKPADLAKITGLSKPQISQYTNGVYSPKPEPLYKIAAALKVNPKWLIGESDTMEDYNTIKAEIEIGGILQENFGMDNLKIFSEWLAINESERVEIESLLHLYSRLDDLDRSAIIGAVEKMMKKMLTDEKYSIQKESSGEKAI